MLEKIISTLAGFIIAVISKTGYRGVLVLMGIESACIPLPSEIIMPFAGYLVSTGQYNLYWMATAGALGCNLGSLIAYEIGHYGGLPLGELYGRYLMLSRADILVAARFFNSPRTTPVFIVRMPPANPVVA